MSCNLTTDDWARFKTEIYSLYIVENRPLPGDDGVIKLMDARFNFKKTKSQYETRFKEWGFEKYSKGTPAEDFKIANYRVNKAKTCGSEIRAYRRGKLVTPRVLSTRGYLTVLELKAFEQASTPPTPPDFSFRMPTASPETYTVPAVTEPISHRYRQEDEDRIREDLLTMEMLYGTAHSDTLGALLKLGEVLIDQGRMEQLASIYWIQGRWKEAESLQVQVMEMSRRILGKEHPDTLNSIRNLALIYQSQGRLKEAESLEVQMMEMSIRVLGKEHPHTLASILNLASTYQSQGRLKEAESLEVQVMEMSIRILGKEHPHTLYSMSYLASTYRSQGRLKEAESLEVQVMEMSIRVLGKEQGSKQFHRSPRIAKWIAQLPSPRHPFSPS
ncbi:hypothetical protein DL768_004220 [Monosporascus sp. mg162]|nr:hypothetical protein DL768_004220 [Monosporascus sp. mg162]